MNSSFEQHILNVMSGRARGIGPSSIRAVLRVAEPFYARATRARNALFDHHFKSSHRLARPVISVGNITTGGTGKTPMVRFLAERLKSKGKNIAILSRGYRAQANSLGDELTMLERALNASTGHRVHVAANSNRFEAGRSLLQEHPEIDLFLLDDGFQHRRLRRNFDLVLISALEPFGFGHVLPRGLLREPLSGLGRADAIVVTHANQVNDDALKAIDKQIRRHNPAAPLYRATHAPVGLLSSDSGTARLPMDRLSELRFFAFCGIGSPSSFERQFDRFGANFVGCRRFGDHHHYSPDDLNDLVRESRSCGAEALITTEKDWVKIEQFACEMPIWRVAMRLQLEDGDDQRLMAQIHHHLATQSAQ